MELLALALVFLPALAAIGIAVSGLRSERALGAAAIAVTGVMLALMLAAVRFGGDGVITVPVMNLSFCFDGFRKLYGTVVCFMWLISALLSPQYFRHHDHLRRYYFFFLLCLGFTAGVFLSADLYTTFLFFELMSLGS